MWHVLFSARTAAREHRLDLRASRHQLSTIVWRELLLDQKRRGLEAAPKLAGADAAFDFCVKAYGVKYDCAVNCLTKDRADLLAFYDFSAEHWKHIRTTNPIESTFATVRHRTTKTTGCLSRRSALAMTHQLMLSAKKKWRKLDGQNRLAEIIQGVELPDNI